MRNLVLRRVSGNPEVVRTVASHHNVEVERLRSVWPVWANITRRFATNVSQHAIWGDQIDLGDLA